MSDHTLPLFCTLTAFLLVGCDDPGPTPTGATVEPSAAAETSGQTAGTSVAGITFPVSGTTSDGDRFQGTATVTDAEWTGAGATLHAQVTGAAADDQQTDPPTTLLFDQLVWEHDDGDLDHESEWATSDDCRLLEVDPGSLLDTETKTTVALDPVQLSMATLPGVGDLLPRLICVAAEASAAASENQG